MHDTARRMRGFTADRELALEIGVEGDAVVQESVDARAAAMPPCAQALEAPSPSGAAEIRVTGRGASFSAQNRPARPPPTMTTSSVLRVRS
jgi:hypothetical protein